MDGIMEKNKDNEHLYEQFQIMMDEVVDNILENILMTFNSREILKTVDDLY